MVRISDDMLKEVVSRLAEALHPDSIYLFGSRSRDASDSGSDIDLLAIVPDTDERPRDLARRGRRSLWGMAVPVDLIVVTRSEAERWAGVSCNLIHTAVAEGRQVCGKNW